MTHIEQDYGSLRREEENRLEEERLEGERVFGLLGPYLGEAYLGYIKTPDNSDDKDNVANILTEKIADAIESGGPATRCQGVRAIVELTRLVPRHNHRTPRF